ncbi:MULTISPECIES: response regulator [Streptomycetaceae]|uniref:Two-component system response regulator n=1 Tax=Streptantibioticus cattleyicolor (strain ATCC 35852 / DSM 46488 / JCM 4925 / NBRC 14057 / NRRL 8057) TaxID=1003195 RepID=F8JQP7_STREN|nr:MULTISPECIES: response regulator transcription factor [Streptomycetaceae]AEW97064.1 two-component system response regulator [Streptantibioticus cattleyicolor NRRL 8057 = DSM 46488]MYS61529.1 response regulator [Streptomyces sp. SID5468]CCB77390.1 Transcriptional regulatory protein liaR [Streptantibioticus cattleyicolor NRRL 8057 = DSM 46488]
MIRVLIVDDHPVVRRGLRAMVDDLPELTAVGEAADGAAALALLESGAAEPDVVLMDLQMAGVPGVAATRRITALPDPPAVLILTTYSTDADILAAVEAGATGYLLKDAPPEEVAAAVRAAARGETVLAPPVAARLLGRVRDGRPALSPRETEILALLAEGLANRQISKRLFISEATVKTHLVHIYDKLGVDSRTGAIAAGLASGLIRPA